MKRARIIAAFAVMLTFLSFADVASAALNVTATASNYFPTVGEIVTIDIYIDTTEVGEARAFGLRMANFDPAVVVNPVATIVPISIFNASPTLPLGGIPNSASGQVEAPGAGRPGWSVNLFQGARVEPAQGGSFPEHFQVQFEYQIGLVTLDIGVFAAYGDAYFGDSLVGEDNVVNNTFLIFPIPEPGTGLLLGIGLAGLGATRRRR